jgi:adenylyltransferase/sulfurtransferase
MENYFKRQIELWSEEIQESLQDKHILIVGCGGLGCSLGIALGAVGIGKITLVDFDTVGIHNIHRQIAFKLSDENNLKSEVLKKNILDRSLYTKVEAINGSFEDYINLNKSDKIDLILDATDNLPVRAIIDRYSKEKSIPWIYGSVEAFHGQVCFFNNASFESIFDVKDRVPEGISTPNVMQIASFQANLAIRYLTQYNIKKDFLYYMFFNNDGEFILQKFGLPS